MWGRFFSAAAGVMLLAEGVFLWRPELLGAPPTPDLGVFTRYRLVVAGLAAAVGAVVVLAQLWRGARARGPASNAMTLQWPAAAPEPEAAPLAAPHLHPAADPRSPPAEVADELEPFPAVPTEVVAVAPAGDRARFLELTQRGHHLRAAGQPEDALACYSEALAIARRRAAAGEEASAQRDLAAALTNLADLHDLCGRIDQAIAAHEESLGVRLALATASPGDPAAQQSLSLGLERLAHARRPRPPQPRWRRLIGWLTKGRPAKFPP